jgi:elongation factor G
MVEKVKIRRLYWQAQKLREEISKIADFDEVLMEKYIGGEEVSIAEIRNAARYAVLNLCITPVFCGSAFKNKGVRLLLDAVVDYLPSPIDRGIVTGRDANHPEVVISRKPHVSEPVTALAFRSTNDAYVGQQLFVRVMPVN